VQKTLAGAKASGLVPQLVRTQKEGTVKEGEDKTTLERRKIPASVTATGRLRTPIEPTLAKTAQELAFGGYASPVVRAYFERDGSPYGDAQTAGIVKLIDSGFDAKKLDAVMVKIRKDKLTKKAERDNALIEAGFTPDQRTKIKNVIWGYTK